MKDDGADTTEAPEARRGPRGARGVVRRRILDAARAVFAEHGWRGATTRDVADAAGVDPRTVAYYFADRAALLEAALEPPPAFLSGVDRINAIPLPRRGAAYVRALLRTWSQPTQRDLLALIIAIGQQHPAGLANLEELHRTRFIGGIARGLTGEDAMLRAGLVAGELVTVSVSRFVWRLEPLASFDDETLVALVGPTVQRYLTGDLPLPPSFDPGRPVAASPQKSSET